MENYLITSQDVDMLPTNLKKSLASCEVFTFGMDYEGATRLDKKELLDKMQDMTEVVYERIENYSPLKKKDQIAFLINNASNVVDNKNFRIVLRLGKRVGVYIILINNKNIIKTTLQKYFTRMVIHSEDNIEIKKGNYYNDT